MLMLLPLLQTAGFAAATAKSLKLVNLTDLLAAHFVFLEAQQ